MELAKSGQISLGETLEGYFQTVESSIGYWPSYFHRKQSIHQMTFGLFLYQKFELGQITMVLRVKGH